MFRNLLRRVLVFGAIFAVGAMALSPGVAAADERPFQATLIGNAHLSETDNPCVMRNDETGEGEATDLGPFTWESVEHVDFCTIPGGVAVSGKFTMTAANGDQLFGKYTTVGLFDEAGNLQIHGKYHFKGGTGQFAGVTGKGDLDAVAFLSPGLPFEGRMAGTIDYGND